MTDKVRKIREEVTKLKSQLLRGACSSQIAMETRCKEEAYNEVLAILDSTQEEPKKCIYSKDDYTDEDRKILCDGCEEDCKYNKKEPVNDKLGGINNAIIQDKLIWQNNIKHDCSFCSMPDCVSSNSSAKDNCLLGRKKEPSIPDIVDEHFYEMLGEEPVSEDLEKIVEEIAEPTILNAYGTKELARRLRNTICSTSVSDDLEEAADNALNNVLNTHEIVNIRSCLEMFRFGANWQKQQMMKDAVEAQLYQPNGLFFVETINKPLKHMKAGDKVKLIIIKED